MKKPAIFGINKHAMEVISLTRTDFDIFAGDDSTSENHLQVSAFDAEKWRMMICVPEPEIRLEATMSFPPETEYFSYIHPTAVIGENVVVGHGSYIGPNCVLTGNIKLGMHTIISRGVQIGIDCTIGDFFTAMPSAIVSSGCTIGDYVYMDTNSVVADGLTIGDYANIGISHTATEDIPDSKPSKPKVSVIILCHNFESYIAESIESVLMQETNFNFEVIVGDDFSTDSSYEVIKSFGGRIRHFRNERNLGAYGNIKKLIDISRGEYIAHLDGDDFFTDPLKLQKQVDFLDANPDYAMHCTGYQYIFEDGSYPDMLLVPLHPTLNADDMEGSNMVGFGRMFRKTKSVTDPWMKESPFLDWCMNFEISLGGKIKCDDWPSGRYRLGAGGMISSLTDIEVAKNNAICRDMIRYRKNR